MGSELEPPQAVRARTPTSERHLTKTDEAETREALRVKLTVNPTMNDRNATIDARVPGVAGVRRESATQL
jgi:hypothetical protein